MARRKKGTALITCDKRTCTILHWKWQALRRNSSYQRAVQECPRNLQALHDQCVIEQQTLGPRPALSTNASRVTAEINGLLRINRSRFPLIIHPPRLEDKRWLLLDLLPDEDAGGLLPTLSAEARLAVVRELVVYWEWEDGNDHLNRYIAEYKRLIDTLESATNFFRSWDPSLESLPGQPSKLSEPDEFTLRTFIGLCSDLRKNPAFLQQFPPLGMLFHQWGILLPVAPEIPQLPLLAAVVVFPDTRPHEFSVVYGMKEADATISVTVRPGASKDPILAEFENKLSFVTSRLNLRRPCYGERVQDLSNYAEMFQAYDLKCAGKSHADIAKQLFPTVFTDDKKPFDFSNREYKNAMQEVDYLLKTAQKHINNSIKNS